GGEGEGVAWELGKSRSSGRSRQFQPSLRFHTRGEDAHADALSQARDRRVDGQKLHEQGAGAAVARVLDGASEQRRSEPAPAVARQHRETDLGILSGEGDGGKRRKRQIRVVEAAERIPA